MWCDEGVGWGEGEGCDERCLVGGGERSRDVSEIEDLKGLSGVEGWGGCANVVKEIGEVGVGGAQG